MVHALFRHHHRDVKVGHTEVQISNPPNMPRTFEIFRDNFRLFSSRHTGTPFFVKYGSGQRFSGAVHNKGPRRGLLGQFNPGVDRGKNVSWGKWETIRVST